MAMDNANQENTRNIPQQETPTKTNLKPELNSEDETIEDLLRTLLPNNVAEARSVKNGSDGQTSQRNDGSKKGDVQDETKVKLKETPSSVKKSDDSHSFTSDLEW